MILNSQDLKEIFNSPENSKEFQVRIYNSYNLFEISKAVISNGTIILFTGDARNDETVAEPEPEDDDGPLVA